MEIAKDPSPYQEKVTSALVKVTRTAGQIASEDLNFHRSSDTKFAEYLDQQNSRLRGLASSILRIATSGSDLPAPVLQNDDSVEENWREIVDVIDQLLEKVDACLDEFTGVIKRLSPSDKDGEKSPPKRGRREAQFPSVYDFSAARIPKPQLLFNRRPNNSDISPFKPLLKSKPHAILPFQSSQQQNELGSYDHPYATEISKAQYPAFVYSSSSPQMYLPFDSTSATFVDTVEGVQLMLTELKGAKEIAVDLEHHDTHSYHGIVCLMQISTRRKDWIIDTLRPWREELHVLNEVFTDPNILKVFHGSNMDIIWLQRDLGLYVVGLFDTYHASVALRYPKRSLKYLLEKFVQLQAEKMYQMADWRVRPLLPGMFDYARSDTHYLLYILDHLRNELIHNSTTTDNLVDYVQERSKEEALQRYERPTYDMQTGQGNGGWHDMLSKSSTLFSREQFAVFKAVHQWRDRIARIEDEGVQYVLSKKALLRIASAMSLDQASLLKLASPTSAAVRVRASELLKVIKDSILAGQTGPEAHEVLRLSHPTSEKLESTLTGVRESQFSGNKNLNVNSPEPIKAEVSRFWGPALQSWRGNAVTAHSSGASTEALQMSLPLPPVSALIPEQISMEFSGSTPVSTTSVANKDTQPKKLSSTSDIFTVKQFGVRRKRKISTSAGEALSGGSEKTTSLSSSESDYSIESPLKKQKQDAVSTIQKSGPHKNGNRNTPPDDITPFDYANADSVFYSNSPYHGRAHSGADQRKAQFNPYPKALEGPQGPRKLKKGGGAGKSHTFR